MTMHAIALHLPDYSVPRSLHQLAVELEDVTAPPPPPAPDVDTLVAEALARGRREGEAAAHAAFERQRAEEAQRHEAQRQEDRKAWTRQESERLAELLEVGLAALEADIAGTLAGLVRPFIARGLGERMLAELHALIAAALRTDGAAIAISGSADLLDQLRTRFGDTARISYEPAESADVRVRFGATVIETQMGVWLSRLGTGDE
ncbi:hypothetical protein [Ancylobacter lacus]|uniref:hypothetical protein n=1 Tax=Ancylobacter lacus TaxID=2579970 RepID=UPI001BCAC822|nr:hypothetical protein [Ancylobacter lacus]MBS7537934.1 hypothetical protein [Ancylobacter lacus]